MIKPEDDIEDRAPVWDVMQGLFMDTDVTLSYDLISRVCAQSKYNSDELEKILFNEVLPAFKFNMVNLPAPEWQGFKTDWVVERVLKKHKYGQRKPWMLRRYTRNHWQILKSLIEGHHNKV